MTFVEVIVLAFACHRNEGNITIYLIKNAAGSDENLRLKTIK